MTCGCVACAGEPTTYHRGDEPGSRRDLEDTVRIRFPLPVTTALRTARANGLRPRVVTFEQSSPEYRMFNRTDLVVERDSLARSSAFLMLSTVAAGAFGFVFWIICARLYTPSDIGRGTSLISAASLIAYVSLLGLNTAFMRFLPTSHGRLRNARIGAGMALVLVAGILISLAYVLVIPLIAPKLSFVRDNHTYGLLFVLLTTSVALNLMTDAVFVAFRATHFSFLTDGIVAGVLKLGLPFMLLGRGAFGVFVSFGLSCAATLALSLVILYALGHHPRVEPRQRPLRGMFRFSAANYVASLLDLTPILVVPIVILNNLGPAAVGYFYLAYQMANLLYSGSYAIAQALIAEGSQNAADLAALRARSAKILGLLMAPAAVVLAVVGPPVLTLFGAQYRKEAGTTLLVLALAAITVSLNSWANALLRLQGQLKILVTSNLLFAVLISFLSVLWVHRGLPWVAAAWLVGSGLPGLFGGAGALFGPRLERERESLRPHGRHRHAGRRTASHRLGRVPSPRGRHAATFRHAVVGGPTNVNDIFSKTTSSRRPRAGRRGRYEQPEETGHDL